MKNITFSAPEEDIEIVRNRALRKGTTLNTEFRKWLSNQAQNEKLERAEQYKKLFDQLPNISLGGPFTREEMNRR